MDVLRGMQYGPHGPSAPRSGTGSGTGTGTGTGSAGTGMSPMTMAILGLLAYKALKSLTHREQPAPAGGPRQAGGGNGGGAIEGRGMPSRGLPSGGMQSRDMQSRDMGSQDMEPRDADMGRGMPGGESGGGASGQGGSVTDLIKGALGGLLAGNAAGGVMGGGLNDLLKQLENKGLGETVDSWVGTGPNKSIAPGDLAKVLGSDQIDAMMAQSGLSREELLDGLSKHLPEVINRLTPEGEVPRHLPM
jgi:uncharacterized protein YidB (DUF937 family)